MNQEPSICCCGDHAWLPLTRGCVALVSPEFVAVVGLWSWYAKFDGRNFYAARSNTTTIEGRRHRFTVRLHQVVCPVPVSLIVDHVNGNTLDNRRDNLRACTTSQNAINRKKRLATSSIYRGVKRAGEKWAAIISIGGRQKFLGTFVEEQDAAKAYDAAAVSMHRDFARLNFPDGLEQRA